MPQHLLILLPFHMDLFFLLFSFWNICNANTFFNVMFKGSCLLDAVNYSQLMCCVIRRTRTPGPTALFPSKSTERNPCPYATCCCRLSNPSTCRPTVLSWCLERIRHFALCLALFQRQSYIKPLSKSLEKRIHLGDFSSHYGE